MTTVVPHRQRGACPTLSVPMPTGDGLLARINLTNGAVSPADLSAIAAAAQRFGNGMLEVTSRGSLQIRGLRAETVPGMNAAIEALGVDIRSGLPIDIAPLAGLAMEERADPRPLALAIKTQSAELAARLGPKVSVVVDGGGPGMLAGMKADIRLTALDAKTWQVTIAGNAETAKPYGLYSTVEAVAVTVEMLGKIAAKGTKARGRDLLDIVAGRSSSPDGFETIQHGGSLSGRTPARQIQPGDILPLRDGRIAAVMALGFGSTTAQTLVDLCASWQQLGLTDLRLAPNHTLILLCADRVEAEAALKSSTPFGLITSRDDPRARIVACAGAPACASAHLDTHQLAADIAAKSADWQKMSSVLHLSGCEKQCSKPAGHFISVIGGPSSRKIVANGIVLPPDFSEMLTAKLSTQRAS